MNFLYRRRKGSVSLTSMLGLIPVTVVLLLTLNLGQSTYEKNSAQDAADAIATAHQLWASRSINTIAMNQVAASQTLSAAVTAEALDEALLSLFGRATAASGYIAQHGASQCPRFKWGWVVAICFVQHVWAISNSVSSAYYTLRTWSKYEPRTAARAADLALRALDRMNREVIARFPRAMEDTARDYASDLNIEAWYILDSCKGAGTRPCPPGPARGGVPLPVKDGGRNGLAEMCQGLYFGTLNGRTGYAARGFPIGKGPMTYGGSNSTPNLMRHANTESDIGNRLDKFYNWHRKLKLMRPGNWKRFPSSLNFRLRQEDGGWNAFTRGFTFKVSSLCSGIGLPNIPFVGGGLKAHVPTFWMATDMNGLSRLGLTRPEQMPEAYQALVAASHITGRRYGREAFGAPPPRGYAYGQAGVFNPASADTFSGGWRGRLGPATRMKDAAQVAGYLTRFASDEFRALSEMLTAAAGKPGWEALNAH